MSVVEDRRRRLTVSHGAPLPEGIEGEAAEQQDATPMSRLEAAGLHEVFSAESLQGKLAISITSVTDADLSERPSYAEKDTEVMSPSQQGGMEWLKRRGIGWCCKKGKKPEAANQDSFSLVIVEDDFALYGVYDGHGPLGHIVSNFARGVLVKAFIADQERSTDAGAAFRRAFAETQSCIEQNRSKLGALDSGSTCTMVYHDIKGEQLTVAHVGDSRAIIGRRSRSVSSAKFEVRDLTVDHKPELPKERERIENSDPPGRVVFDGYFNHRIFAQDGMYPGLNMSRALGDVTAHKKAGLSAEPDIAIVNLREECGDDNEVVCLICSDGVWEFIESKEAVEIISAYTDEQVQTAIEKLSSTSYNRWMKDSDDEISDDITGMLIRFGPRDRS
eukprot:TRINITY_DN15427_c0_g1_i1.p1 TRINITY_DN15427_c0_g1~~TRINITY_DN15427_c0_g1_i1.p1  ORF type:complete len:389 (-),score=64.13 TRINITY_DN15427_c0_g1_i1:336-1502(-)